MTTYTEEACPDKDNCPDPNHNHTKSQTDNTNIRISKPLTLKNDTKLELGEIIESFYRGYEIDMASVLPPIGTVPIQDQQRQSEHFWKKRMKTAKQELTKLIQTLELKARLDERRIMNKERAELGERGTSPNNTTTRSIE